MYLSVHSWGGVVAARAYHRDLHALLVSEGEGSQ